MRFLKKLHRNSFLVIVCVLLSPVAMLTGCYADAPLTTGEAVVPFTPQITITTADTTATAESPFTVDLGQVDDVCRITDAGSYMLSGHLTGRIEIDAQDQVVQVILAGVEVTSSSGPAFQVLSAGKVIISLQEGTENTFLDGAAYPQNSIADACIYSECDLTVNGTGSLNIIGYFQDGVHTKDVLKILGGNVFVQAKQDGLQGNDGIVVTCASLQVQSERHGLYTTKTGKISKGNMEIYNGGHSVVAGGYAFSCAADLYIDQCQMHAMGVLGIHKTAGNAYVMGGTG